MKLAVVGSRTFSNYNLLCESIDSLGINISEIVSGGASGADSLAEKWAKENEIPYTIIKPDWAKYGKGAGIKRNKQIIESCDQCLAFWDGKSKGTASGIKLAKQLNKPIHLILYNTN